MNGLKRRRRKNHRAASVADLVEDYFGVWLRGCELGHRSVEALGFDGAMDALWESLNAGFIKLEANSEGFTGIKPCFPPQPPEKQLARPSTRRWADA